MNTQVNNIREMQGELPGLMKMFNAVKKMLLRFCGTQESLLSIMYLIFQSSSSSFDLQYALHMRGIMYSVYLVCATSTF